MSKKLWYLKQLEVFSAVPKDELESLGKMMREKEVLKHTLLFQSGDKNKIFFIKTGRVTLYHLTRDGKKIIIDTLGPGSIFGDIGSGWDDATVAEASSDAFVCITTKDSLFEMIKIKGKVAENLLKLLFQKLSKANDKVVTMALPNPRDRFKRLLLDLGEQHGEDQGNCWIKINIPFTEEELANMLGVSRVTVSKIVTSFKKEGILKRSKKIISFHNERCAEFEKPLIFSD